MKKNLLSFIGSLVAMLSIFFLATPYLTYSNSYYSSRETVKISIQNLLGICNDSYSSFTMGGMLLAASFFFTFASLIIVIIGILRNKDVNDKALILSSVNTFTVIYTIISLTNVLKSERVSYSLGWGIVCVLMLFTAFFVLTLVGFILSNTSAKQDDKSKKYDDIYMYKKLLDEGIITKEEFDEKKKQLFF